MDTFEKLAEKGNGGANVQGERQRGASRDPADPRLSQLRAMLDESPRVQSLIQQQQILNPTYREADPAPAQSEENRTGLPDRLKAGVESTAILFGEMDIAIIAGLKVVLLAGLVLLGREAGLGLWFGVGLGAAGLCGLRQLWLIRRREPAECLRAFANNAWFGGAIFVGIALDYLFRGA